jgi:hypothetical protein
MESYLLLTPLAVLAVLLLFRFVGCDRVFGLETVPDPGEYNTRIFQDHPVAYFPLQEKALVVGGVTAAANLSGAGGEYGLADSPLVPAHPTYLSPTVPVTVLELGVNEQPILLESEPNDTAIRVNGGYVVAPASAIQLDAASGFTLEILMFPEWNLEDLGNFYCVMESSMRIPAFPPHKNAGFAIYAGPDDLADPNSPYHWQVWAGDGVDFARLNEVKPYNHPESNPGPQVEAVTTYLAVTVTATQSTLFLYTPDRDLNFLKYELAPPTNFTPATQHLYLGITGFDQGPLFPPFPGPPDFLYPFAGRMAHVAFYNKVLTEERLLVHGLAAFTGPVS